MTLTKATYSMIDGASANVLDFGADPTGVADSRDAIVNAILTDKAVYFPAGTYKIASSIDFGAIANSTSIEIRNVVLYGEGAYKSIITYTGTGTMLIGGTNGPASGGYIQSLNMQGLSVRGTGVQGSGTPATFGLFTGVPSVFAGTNSTQKMAFWEFEAPSTISECEFAFWGTVIEFKFGYNATLSNNYFSYNNLCLNIGNATTSITIDTNIFQRNAIGIGLFQASLIRIVNNVLQGNYAGCDIVAYNWNQQVNILRNYFEASPKVFYLEGDSGEPFTCVGFTFEENKALEVDIRNFANNFRFVKNFIKSFNIESPAVDNIVVSDNYDNESGGYDYFVNWTGSGQSALIMQNSPFIGSGVASPGTINAGVIDSATFAVPGATTFGDFVELSYNQDLQGVLLYGFVKSDNLVQYVFYNPTAAPVTLAAGTVFARVSKRLY